MRHYLVGCFAVVCGQADALRSEHDDVVVREGSVLRDTASQRDTSTRTNADRDDSWLSWEDLPVPQPELVDNRGDGYNSRLSMLSGGQGLYVSASCATWFYCSI